MFPGKTPKAEHREKVLRELMASDELCDVHRVEFWNNPERDVRPNSAKYTHQIKELGLPPSATLQRRRNMPKYGDIWNVHPEESVDMEYKLDYIFTLICASTKKLEDNNKSRDLAALCLESAYNTILLTIGVTGNIVIPIFENFVKYTWIWEPRIFSFDSTKEDRLRATIEKLDRYDKDILCRIKDFGYRQIIYLYSIAEYVYTFSRSTEEPSKVEKNNNTGIIASMFVSTIVRHKLLAIYKSISLPLEEDLCIKIDLNNTSERPEFSQYHRVIRKFGENINIAYKKYNDVNMLSGMLADQGSVGLYLAVAYRKILGYPIKTFLSIARTSAEPTLILICKQSREYFKIFLDLISRYLKAAGSEKATIPDLIRTADKKPPRAKPPTLMAELRREVDILISTMEDLVFASNLEQMQACVEKHIATIGTIIDYSIIIWKHVRWADDAESKNITEFNNYLRILDEVRMTDIWHSLWKHDFCYFNFAPAEKESFLYTSILTKTAHHRFIGDIPKFMCLTAINIFGDVYADSLEQYSTIEYSDLERIPPFPDVDKLIHVVKLIATLSNPKNRTNNSTELMKSVLTPGELAVNDIIYYVNELLVMQSFTKKIERGLEDSVFFWHFKSLAAICYGTPAAPIRYPTMTSNLYSVKELIPDISPTVFNIYSNKPFLIQDINQILITDYDCISSSFLALYMWRVHQLVSDDHEVIYQIIYHKLEFIESLINIATRECKISQKHRSMFVGIFRCEMFFLSKICSELKYILNLTYAPLTSPGNVAQIKSIINIILHMYTFENYNGRYLLSIYCHEYIKMQIFSVNPTLGKLLSVAVEMSLVFRNLASFSLMIRSILNVALFLYWTGMTDILRGYCGIVLPMLEKLYIGDIIMKTADSITSEFSNLFVGILEQIAHTRADDMSDLPELIPVSATASETTFDPPIIPSPKKLFKGPRTPSKGVQK
jgi:hypothetical protein